MYQEINIERLHPTLTRLLINRGFCHTEMTDFFSWDLKSIPDFELLLDLKKASNIIITAINDNKKIGIYGDYDVDGSTSCALLYHFFKMIGTEVLLFQPSRFIEGYGLHLSSIEEAINKNVNLLITVDCGITSNEAATYAKEKRLGLIITDHHQDVSSAMPEALAIINPNRRDQDTNNAFKNLAGVGVAFALAVQIRKDLIEKGAPIPSLYPLLQFVAIGSIADLAKMDKTNLRLIRHGLGQLKNTKYPGIQPFFTPEERASDGIVPSEKISFSIGPMINSKGRLDHPDKALKLLALEEDRGSEAYPIYTHLEICNNERKSIQKKVYDDAHKQIIQKLDGLMPTINIVYSKEWHEGVIGIVASKLVEAFKIPAICFTHAGIEGVIKGSARSAGDLNIFEELNRCSDLFIKFGGHKAAAGLSMLEINLPELTRRLEESIKKIPLITRTNQDYFDLEISPSDITPSLVKGLDQFEPFGIGNPRPIFRFKDLLLDSFEIMKESHVRWNFSDKNRARQKFKGISFNYVGKWGVETPLDIFNNSKGSGILVYGTLSINKFRGNEYLQIQVNKISAGMI